MKNFTHEDQQKIWDAEHRRPTVLLQVDSEDVSSGVRKFWEFLIEKGALRRSGVEMGCGKGRNVIWLASNGVEMHGFDFSPVAIEEARGRAKVAGVKSAYFDIQDATKRWNYENDTFDFAIDCFALTDIESAEGRAFAVGEFRRVLKPGGYLLAYLLSSEDEFHAEMMRRAPAEQPNAFHHPTGKFEKMFDEEEIQSVYRDFNVEQWERIQKTATFHGKEYQCFHHYLVLSK